MIEQRRERSEQLVVLVGLRLGREPDPYEGPLAELELGPVARNIAGARRAAERILTATSNRVSEASVECASASA